MKSDWDSLRAVVCGGGVFHVAYTGSDQAGVRLALQGVQGECLQKGQVGLGASSSKSPTPNPPTHTPLQLPCFTSYMGSPRYVFGHSFFSGFCLASR